MANAKHSHRRSHHKAGVVMVSTVSTALTGASAVTTSSGKRCDRGKCQPSAAVLILARREAFAAGRCVRSAARVTQKQVVARPECGVDYRERKRDYKEVYSAEVLLLRAWQSLWPRKLLKI